MFRWNSSERNTMAKIIKITSTTPRIANQFKTSRNSTTNPFKYQNFEGNTLDISAFADVFESSAVKESSKMKLIASSVAGSMHKIKSSIAEPIVNFVNRVRDAVVTSWDYAKNTDVSISNAVKGIESVMNTKFDIPGLRKVDELIHKPIEFSGIKSVGANIKNGIGVIGENMVDFGKDINSKWSALISKINGGRKISSEMSVGELEELWKSEISASENMEAA